MRSYPVFLGLSLLLASACAKKTPAPEENTQTTTSTGATSEIPQPEPQIAEREVEETPASDRGAGSKVKENLSRVYFGFNDASLNAESRAALDENARIMKDHSEIVVEVQGHTDERGTEEYNLALGERRAKAVVDYLVRLGVPEDHVRMVSFGEAKPVDEGSDEEAWSKNRRADFRVTEGGMIVSGTVEEEPAG